MDLPAFLLVQDTIPLVANLGTSFSDARLAVFHNWPAPFGRESQWVNVSVETCSRDKHHRRASVTSQRVPEHS